jgi:hypothetical protein
MLVGYGLLEMLVFLTALTYITYITQFFENNTTHLMYIITFFDSVQNYCSSYAILFSELIKV